LNYDDRNGLKTELIDFLSDDNVNLSTKENETVVDPHQSNDLIRCYGIIYEYPNPDTILSLPSQALHKNMMMQTNIIPTTKLGTTAVTDNYRDIKTYIQRMKNIHSYLGLNK
jgi:hypothetical protein